MLDMWLPILQPLRKKLQDTEFVLLFPEGRQIGVLNLRDALFEIASPIFDKVLYPSVTGQWKQAKNLAEAQKSHESEPAVRLWRSLKQRGLAEPLRGLIASARRLATERRNSKSEAPDVLTGLIGEESVILFNISEVDKPYMAVTLKGLNRKQKKFSMYHGIKLEDHPLVGEKSVSKFDSTNTVALLFSPREREYYLDYYGLTKKNLRVVGVPRHEDEWIDQLTSLHAYDGPALPPRFIFVVSRPANEYASLSRASKLDALRDIGEVARQLDCHILIKLHPKQEDDDGTAEEALGLENLGQSWGYSHAHPLLLGRHCEFAVSFLSSVAVDMAKIGTPIIEYMDWRIGMPRDAPWPYYLEGKPVSINCHLGFALPASDRTQFLQRVGQIRTDRTDVVDSARRAYQRVFPETPDICEKIANEIAGKLSGQGFPGYGDVDGLR